MSDEIKFKIFLIGLVCWPLLHFVVVPIIWGGIRIILAIMFEIGFERREGMSFLDYSNACFRRREHDLDVRFKAVQERIEELEKRCEPPITKVRKNL